MKRSVEETTRPEDPIANVQGLPHGGSDHDHLLLSSRPSPTAAAVPGWDAAAAASHAIAYDGGAPSRQLTRSRTAWPASRTTRPIRASAGKFFSGEWGTVLHAAQGVRGGPLHGSVAPCRPPSRPQARLSSTATRPPGSGPRRSRARAARNTRSWTDPRPSRSSTAEVLNSGTFSLPAARRSAAPSPPAVLLNDSFAQ
jgi:hypothetical protein